MMASASAGFHLCMTANSPPLDSAISRLVMPDMWNIGKTRSNAGAPEALRSISTGCPVCLAATVSARSRLKSPSRATWHILRWVIVAPLARPVVPDVNWMIAGSSGSGSGMAGRSGAGSAFIIACSSAISSTGQRAVPLSCPARCSSARISRQSVRAAASAISSSVPRLLISAAIAPVRTIAKKPTNHSRQLRMARPTTSPVPTQCWAWRPAASLSACSNTSLNVTRTPPNSRKSRSVQDCRAPSRNRLRLRDVPA